MFLDVDYVLVLAKFSKNQLMAIPELTILFDDSY